MIDLNELRNDTPHRQALLDTIKEACRHAIQFGFSTVQARVAYQRFLHHGASEPWTPAATPVDVVAQQADPSVIVQRICDLLAQRSPGAGFHGRIRIEFLDPDGRPISTYEREVTIGGRALPPGPAAGYAPGYPPGYPQGGAAHGPPPGVPPGAPPGYYGEPDSTPGPGYDFGGPTTAEPTPAESALLRYAERRHDGDREQFRWLIDVVVRQADARVAAAEEAARRREDQAVIMGTLAVELANRFTEAQIKLQGHSAPQSGWDKAFDKGLDILDRKLNPSKLTGLLGSSPNGTSTPGSAANVRSSVPEQPRHRDGYTPEDEAREDVGGGDPLEPDEPVEPEVELAPEPEPPPPEKPRRGLRLPPGGTEHARKLLGGK